MKTSGHSVCSLSFQRKRRSITLTTCDWLVSFTNELKLLLLSSIFQSWVIWWHQRQQVQFITKAKTHWVEMQHWSNSVYNSHRLNKEVSQNNCTGLYNFMLCMSQMIPHNSRVQAVYLAEQLEVCPLMLAALHLTAHDGYSFLFCYSLLWIIKTYPLILTKAPKPDCCLVL